MDAVPDIEDHDTSNVSEAWSKLDDLLNEIADKNDEIQSSDEEKYKKSEDMQVQTPTKKPFPGRAPRRKKRKDRFEEGLIWTSNKQGTIKENISMKRHKISHQSISFVGGIISPVSAFGIVVSYNIRVCIKNCIYYFVKCFTLHYVVKVFDRRVNLANFTRETPLYAMLREWMRNKPHVTAHSDVDDLSRIENVVSEHAIHQLPEAIKVKGSDFPPLIPRDEHLKPLDELLDSNEHMEELKTQNMNRWKKVKTLWKDYSLAKQSRHFETIQLLKSIMQKETIMGDG